MSIVSISVEKYTSKEVFFFPIGSSSQQRTKIRKKDVDARISEISQKSNIDLAVLKLLPTAKVVEIAKNCKIEFETDSGFELSIQGLKVCRIGKLLIDETNVIEHETIWDIPNLFNDTITKIVYAQMPANCFVTFAGLEYPAYCKNGLISNLLTDKVSELLKEPAYTQAVPVAGQPKVARTAKIDKKDIIEL